MKNRRLVLVAFLLCASILVGVGFADVVAQLQIDGTLSNSPDITANEYLDEIHFTGQTMIVDGDHKEVTNGAIITNVQNKTQRATLTASFNSSNIDAFKPEGESQLEAGVVFEFAVVAEAGTTVTVDFDAIDISGQIGVDVPFNVSSHVKSTWNGEGTDLPKVEVVATDDAAVSQTFYLHVKITMAEQFYNVDVDSNEFTVVLPILNVATVPNTTTEG